MRQHGNGGHSAYRPPSQQNVEDAGGAYCRDENNSQSPVQDVPYNNCRPLSTPTDRVSESPSSSAVNFFRSLPDQIQYVLKSWLMTHATHPYPTENEMRLISSQTGLTMSQIDNWFAVARQHLLQPTPPPPPVASGPTTASHSSSRAGPGDGDSDDGDDEWGSSKRRRWSDNNDPAPPEEYRRSASSASPAIVSTGRTGGGHDRLDGRHSMSPAAGAAGLMMPLTSSDYRSYGNHYSTSSADCKPPSLFRSELSDSTNNLHDPNSSSNSSDYNAIRSSS